MKTILCLLILAGFSAVYGQEKPVQPSEFETIIKNASEILKTKPHRMIVTQTSLVNGKPQESSSLKSIVQVAGTDKRHSVREYKSAAKNVKREYIKFGEKTYFRENDGQWTQSRNENNPSQGNLKTLSEESQYQFLGKEMLNNQSVSVYRRMRTATRIDVSNNEEIQSTETVKYWFDANGMLLKRESERENRRGGKVFNFKTVATFDYDGNIQIVAPQVAGN